MIIKNLADKLWNGTKKIFKEPITYIAAAGILATGLYSNNALSQNIPNINSHKSGTGYCADTSYYDSQSGWITGKCPGKTNIQYSATEPTLKDKYKTDSKPKESKTETFTNVSDKKEETRTLTNESDIKTDTSKLRTGQSIRDVYEYDFFINSTGEAKINGAGWHNNDYLIDIVFEKGDKKIKIYPNTEDTANYAPDYSLSIDELGGVKIQNFKPNAEYTLVKLDKEIAKLARFDQSPLGIGMEKAIKSWWADCYSYGFFNMAFS